jgi:hypothetical protein
VTFDCSSGYESYCDTDDTDSSSNSSWDYNGVCVSDSVAKAIEDSSYFENAEKQCSGAVALALASGLISTLALL